MVPRGLGNFSTQLSVSEEPAPKHVGLRASSHVPRSAVVLPDGLHREALRGFQVILSLSNSKVNSGEHPITRVADSGQIKRHGTYQ